MTSKERKQVFDKYVRERADEERKEKKAKAKERKDAFRSLCEDKNVTSKTSWSDFSREVAKDERFKAIDKNRDRESLFNEFQSEIRKKERDEKEERRKISKKDFKALLKETESIDRHSHWSDIKKTIDKDERYLAVDSGSLREDWFYDYVQDLKDEHKREKEKKKSAGSRSRSKSRGRKRSRSRSRSKDRKKRDKSRDKKKKKDKERSRSKDRKKKDKREREEGEMTGDEDGEIMSGSEKGRRDSKEDKEEAPEAVQTNNGQDNTEHTSDVTDEQKEKEERIAASLRKREEEVKANLAGSMRERDKERGQHLHQEAINGFNALLTDLIRTPDYSWKEAKKLLKKDSRWDLVEGNLEKSERERLFDDHIDRLIGKPEHHVYFNLY